MCNKALLELSQNFNSQYECVKFPSRICEPFIMYCFNVLHLNIHSHCYSANLSEKMLQKQVVICSLDVLTRNQTETVYKVRASVL